MDLSATRDLPELLWSIAEHKIESIDALPISPLLQQAVDDGLVHWPSQEDEISRLRLTSKGRQHIGLPPLTSPATEGSEWLRSVGRRALRRF